MICLCHLRDMACSVAGITSDANVLTRQLRLLAQRYMKLTSLCISCYAILYYFIL